VADRSATPQTPIISGVIYSTYITKYVFDVMMDISKFGGEPKQLMWESRSWSAGTEFGAPSVYRASWWWKATVMRSILSKSFSGAL
jgi:hypothetical protein